MLRILKIAMILLFATLSQTGAIYVPFGTKTHFPSNGIPDSGYPADKNGGLHRTNLYYKKIYVNPYYIVPYETADPPADAEVRVEVEVEEPKERIDIEERVERDFYEQTKSKKPASKKTNGYAYHKSKFDSNPRTKYSKSGDNKFVKTSDGKYVRVKDLSIVIDNAGTGNIDNNNNYDNRYYKLKDASKPVWEIQEDDVTQRTIYKFILPEPRIKKTWD